MLLICTYNYINAYSNLSLHVFLLVCKSAKRFVQMEVRSGLSVFFFLIYILKE